MSRRSKLFFLSFILAIDILFFVVVVSMYPEYFNLLLSWIPLDPGVSTAIIILSGLIIAVVTSLAVIKIVISIVGEVLG